MCSSIEVMTQLESLLVPSAQDNGGSLRHQKVSHERDLHYHRMHRSSGSVTKSLMCGLAVYLLAPMVNATFTSECFVPSQIAKSALNHKQQASTNNMLICGSLFSTKSSSKSSPKFANRKRGNNMSRSKQNAATMKKHGSGPQTWRVFGIQVHPDSLGSKSMNPLASVKRGSVTLPVDKMYLYPPVLEALLRRLKIKTAIPMSLNNGNDENIPSSASLPPELLDVRVVRRSLDARKKGRQSKHKKDNDEDSSPMYTYVLDIDIKLDQALNLHLREQSGRLECLSLPGSSEGVSSLWKQALLSTGGEIQETSDNLPRVVVVGAGPAGLFCALTLARSGKCKPILLERGQPVESRGKDIGALIHRRNINTESNFAFGEGGAGTWSDGKLTTRIGRNSDAVRSVLETLVEYGAPEKILIDGSPHLGTDNLVRLLRNMRQDLRKAGGEIRFGAKMTKLHQADGYVTGVDVTYTEAKERNMGESSRSPSADDKSETITGDVIVLATGHSARDVYEELHSEGVKLEAKGFAAGFRIEHPQRIINKIQYGKEWGPSVVTGKGPTDTANNEQFESSQLDDSHPTVGASLPHQGRLPVASYRLATDKAFDGKENRGVYSFCMCPGGQIVMASTDPTELCVNGMSFSKRDSLWANSALVVTIAPDDAVLDSYRTKHGVLAGLAFQRDMEHRASIMGGSDLTVPVQRLTDFMDGKSSTSAPTSSYRLGVKPSPCHEIYPAPMVNALRDAIVNHFEKQMPGFLCEDALLHAVETRTSSPVRISRDPSTLQAIGVKRLYPAGEGAGFAGGIVSAAVDGLMVADSILGDLMGNTESGIKKQKSVGFDY